MSNYPYCPDCSRNGHKETLDATNFCIVCQEEKFLDDVPTYTASQVQEMKNAWVDEVARKIEKLELNVIAEYVGVSMRGEVALDLLQKIMLLLLDDMKTPEPEVLATIKEMKE